jgi:hypothetical protein
MADKESVRQQLYDHIEKNLNEQLPVSSSELKTLAETFAILAETEERG